MSFVVRRNARRRCFADDASPMSHCDPLTVALMRPSHGSCRKNVPFIITANAYREPRGRDKSHVELISCFDCQKKHHECKICPHLMHYIYILRTPYMYTWCMDMGRAIRHKALPLLQWPRWPRHAPFFFETACAIVLCAS